MDQKLTRIGIFYDGNFFLHVSNYYHYFHERRARINISGLHDYIRHKVSSEEGVDARYCQIVDAHYFRGRLHAQDAKQRDMLLKERVFDDVLMREGVTTHYLPVGPQGEKGVDVWLALEAYELAIYKKFDVSVFVAGDGDFVPLIRKLNTLGTRVMLLAWDFKYTDQNGQEKETRTAQRLLDEVTYPVLMHQVIDDRVHKNDAMVNALFMQEARVRELPPGHTGDESSAGVIQNLKDGFGFITPDTGGVNLFFYWTSVAGANFADLKIGDKVEYEIGFNDKGPCAISVKVTG
jgi:cold shock CspA family protein